MPTTDEYYVLKKRTIWMLGVQCWLIGVLTGAIAFVVGMMFG